jgi:endonuclease YncB( thermonuclease family)
VSKHWKPDNVVRGPWLRPEAYNALSPAEKRALSRERQGQRARKKGRSAKQGIVGPALILMMLACVATWELIPAQWSAKPAASASGASEVRASFSACKWGGGSNCVVDGDTIFLDGQKIRIAGIDAPETHDYGCASELALGERAAARLRDLVSSGALTLTSIDRDEDRYGRKLRNVAVDGRDVGAVLVSEGLAREYGGGRQPWCSA